MTLAPTPKQLLSRYGLRPKRHFGQNFLADERLVTELAELSTTPCGGSVVEIGAGLGSLTRPLLRRAGQVTVIERDRELIPVLEQEFRGALEAGSLGIVEADAKQVDFAALFAGGPRPYVLAGNIPYSITGPLLRKTVALAHKIDRAVLLVQLEVAQRITASVGDPAYGALSVFVRAQLDARRARIIRRGAFFPQPAVDSAVVVLTPLAEPHHPETELFRNLVQMAFEQRRKMLRNAWQKLPGIPRGRLVQAALSAHVDLDQRGETLSVEDFSRMAKELS